MPTYTRLTNLSGAEEFPALSPDGQLVAFVHRANGKANIFAQRAGSRKPSNLTADCDRESDAPGVLAGRRADRLRVAVRRRRTVRDERDRRERRGA